MRYGVLLTALGLAQVALAFSVTAPLFWLLGWSGLSWILAGAAYFGLGARVFGKRRDGGVTLWNAVLLFPYLLVTWILWFAQTRLTKESPHNEIVPGLWLGRLCSVHELPAGIEMVVDLTSEFGEPAAVRQGRQYLGVPTLDADVPSLEEFDWLVREAARFDGPIYIHCALGHGRSATAVVAVLVVRGDAASLDQAEQMVKAARPGVEIKAPQRALLKRWSEGQKAVSISS